MIQYIEATPTADEFNTLTDSVGWGCTNREIVEKALKNTETYAIQDSHKNTYKFLFSGLKHPIYTRFCFSIKLYNTIISTLISSNATELIIIITFI